MTTTVTHLKDLLTAAIKGYDKSPTMTIATGVMMIPAAPLVIIIGVINLFREAINFAIVSPAKWVGRKMGLLGRREPQGTVADGGEPEANSAAATHQSSAATGAGSSAGAEATFLVGAVAGSGVGSSSASASPRGQS